MNKQLLSILYIILLGAFFSFPESSRAAGGNTIQGRVVEGANYRVLLIAKDGSTKSKKANGSGNFSFQNLTVDFVLNARLQLVKPNGRFFGPVVLAQNEGLNRSFVTFSGVFPESGVLDLGDIELKNGYAKLETALGVEYLKTTGASVVRANSNGKPIGAGKSGLVSSNTAVTLPISLAAITGSTSPGGDYDRDGVINSLDADDDGDLNLDGTDEQSASTTASSNPFTTLYLGMSETLNVNVGSGVTDTAIDNVISGENFFNLIMFLSLTEEESDIDGGHIRCSSALDYCRSNADGGGTAIYAGVSESDNSLRGLVWTDMNANESGYPNLELITVGDSRVLVASIQPRVGTSEFRPGDVYTVELTDGRRVVSRRILTLAPYFVTVPALTTYEAGSGEGTVDYSNTSGPGMNSSNPIVLTGAGTMRFTFYRPQRKAVAGAESGSYFDMGHLHYGVIIGGLSQEVSCSGLYSSLSSTLTEDGEESSLWPLTDSANDAIPSTSSTLSFTVDLASCLDRASGSPGVYQVTLTAAGENLSGGANRAAQNIHVTIP